MGLTTNHYEYRAKAIEQIKQSGIPVYTGGGYEHRVSLAKMADIYRDSLFVINFAGKPDRIGQCKGRVIEATLCGACLVEFNNPETNHWLRPDIDYVAYERREEIPAKIQTLLENPEKLEQIRQSGRQRAHQLFGTGIAWKQILNFAEKQLKTPDNYSQKENEK